ncbi:MAG: cardiolipin synthase [Gemmatimonadetes bacterium]|nr:cardiolipin synthase [Gemmatimonadota bacterium]
MDRSISSLLGWIIRLVMIPVVARRHRPVHALAWLSPIFLFPRAGTALYLWLARYGLARSAERHRHVRDVVERDDRLRGQEGHRARLSVPDAQNDLVRLGERLSTHEMGGFPILGGNDVQLLTEPGQMPRRLVDDIEAARSHVHLLFYTFLDDATGRAVAQALARAAARGVRCRVLVDAWCTRRMRRSLGPWMKARGIELHPMLPLGGMGRADVRNHRKIAVVDGRVAYTGSDNIHDPGHDLRGGVWHQVSARVHGPAALQLQMLFVEDWYFATGQVLRGNAVFPEPDRPGAVAVQTIPGGPSYGAPGIQHVLVQALSEARRQVVLTTPYLVPDEPVLLALRLAALRGVRTDVVLPARSDRRVADLAGRAYFQEMLDAGVRIHLHPAGILHAKTVAVDHAFAIVGTANLDRRSLYLNYEDVLVLYDRECVDQLRATHARYLRESHPVDAAGWAARPPRQAYVQHTAKLLSPIL